MNSFCSGWYLIYTRPHHEKKVVEQLIKKNINAFFPTTKILSRWHDRNKVLDHPLFPSYVFIYLKDLREFYHGMDTQGALSYVKIGKSIARVEDDVIHNIKLFVNSALEIEVSAARIQKGQKLTICEGALIGLCGEVIEIEKKQKLLVRVDLLQRNILISLPENYFIPVSGDTISAQKRINIR